MPLIFRGAPSGSAELAVAADRGLTLAQILRAYLHLYATSASGVKAAAILDNNDRVSHI
jgi:hypothetical protein